LLRALIIRFCPRSKDPPRRAAHAARAVNALILGNPIPEITMPIAAN
jgi:hypothetical protein